MVKKLLVLILAHLEFPRHTTRGADSWREAEMYQGGAPDEYMIDSVQSLLQNGSNVIAIQVHNFNIESSDLTLIPFLTLGLTNPPDNADGISEYLDISNVLLHTNFKNCSFRGNAYAFKLWRNGQGFYFLGNHVIGYFTGPATGW